MTTTEALDTGLRRGYSSRPADSRRRATKTALR